MQCAFEQRGDWWVCLQCGVLVPRRGDKPPRATCAGQWRKRKALKQPQPTREERLLARYGAAKMADPPRAEIERRAAVCEACERYADYECVAAASRCKRPVRWQERVLLGTCPRFTSTD